MKFSTFKLSKQYSLQLFTNNGESNEVGAMAMIANHPSNETYHVLSSIEELSKFHGAAGTTFANRTLIPNYKRLLEDIKETPTHYVTNARQMLWVVYANDNFSVLLFKDAENRKKWHKIIQPMFVKIGSAPYYTSTFKRDNEGCSTVEAAQAKVNTKQHGFTDEEKLHQLYTLMNTMGMDNAEVIKLLGGHVQLKVVESKPEVSLEELDQLMTDPVEEAVSCEECNSEDATLECISKIEEAIVHKYSVVNTLNSSSFVKNKFKELRKQFDNDAEFISTVKATDGSNLVDIKSYTNAVLSNKKAA
ncbi:hypothetical protein [Vibrio vulnificus]|uniref:hypothetical protein n=1 Tax=Vibrio vulnificus TaxID=672 RepID=UPI003241EC24